MWSSGYDLSPVHPVLVPSGAPTYTLWTHEKKEVGAHPRVGSGEERSQMERQVTRTRTLSCQCRLDRTRVSKDDGDSVDGGPSPESPPSGVTDRRGIWRTLPLPDRPWTPTVCGGALFGEGRDTEAPSG